MSTWKVQAEQDGAKGQMDTPEPEQESQWDWREWSRDHGDPRLGLKEGELRMLDNKRHI